MRPDNTSANSNEHNYHLIIRSVADGFRQLVSAFIPLEDEFENTNKLVNEIGAWGDRAARSMDDIDSVHIHQAYASLHSTLCEIEKSISIPHAFSFGKGTIESNFRNATQVLTPEQYEALNAYVLSSLEEKSPVIIHDGELRKQLGAFEGRVWPAYNNRAKITPPPFDFSVKMVTPCSSMLYPDWVEIEFETKEEAVA